jgi:hypothetical protein
MGQSPGGEEDVTAMLLRDRPYHLLRRAYHAARKARGLPVREDIFRALRKHAVCAELGVFRGEFSRMLLRYAAPREVHLVDAWWTLYGKCYPDWGRYTNHGRLTTAQAHAEVERLAGRYRARADIRIHVGDDVEYLETLPDAYFDWVYVDSTHVYEHTARELDAARRKVKADGCIAGHDWYDEAGHMHAGVRKAVEEFCARHGWHVTYRDSFTQWIIAPR